jgi:small multidrug resistance pump
MRLFFDAALLAGVLALSHALMRTIGMRSSQKGLMDMLLSNWHLFLAALALYGFVFVYYTAALRHQKLALLYPLYTGLSVMLVLAAGVYHFGEGLSGPQIVGCLLMAAGIFMIVR